MIDYQYLILEIANTHGGEKKYLFRLIDKFSKLDYRNIGIKFQIFKYDKISLRDYSWYNDYKKLFFNIKEWDEIINYASIKFNEIWIDIFDLYGLNYFRNNADNFVGVKLQASVLQNYEVLNELLKIKLENKKLILNISGYEITEIETFIREFEKLKPEEMILQIGYQNYPSEVKDTQLNKIKIIKSAFPECKISFADHLQGESEESILIPSIVSALKVDYIEKHICIDRNKTKYDAFSSLHFEELSKLVNNFKSIGTANANKFITDNERNYLKKSVQKVVLKTDKINGSLISTDELTFLRTDKDGINLNELKYLQNNRMILNKNKLKHETVCENDFGKTNIGVIVAGRMKSKRLKNKAIMEINGIPSVELCLQSCLKIQSANIVILATSNLRDDSILRNYTLNGKVKFWQGHPDDVIARYIGACEKYNIDVVIRVTADCPFISNEIAEILIKSHFENGADYTAAKEFSVGTSTEIINTEALKRVIKYKKDAKYSEYMTWYYQNNKDVFKVNLVDLPKDLIRDYRLTLDYEKDLFMFNSLIDKLKKENMDINLVNIFKVLDGNPEIPKINNYIKLKYKTNKSLIETLNKETRIKM
jgi:N,N'-diacetyllegionaminate synthase